MFSQLQGYGILRQRSGFVAELLERGISVLRKKSPGSLKQGKRSWSFHGNRWWMKGERECNKNPKPPVREIQNREVLARRTNIPKKRSGETRTSLAGAWDSLRWAAEAVTSLWQTNFRPKQGLLAACILGSMTEPAQSRAGSGPQPSLRLIDALTPITLNSLHFWETPDKIHTRTG